MKTRFRHLRRHRLLTGVAVCAVAAVGSSTGATSVAASDLFDAFDAAVSLENVDPTAVGADPAQQKESAPDVAPTTNGFAVLDADVDATIPKAADDSIQMKTDGGEMRITPLDVADGASAGRSVNEGAAVVYAGTGTDSDTSIVPLDTGVESFTSIRSADAAESFSWEVSLPGDERLEQRADGSIVVVDPTPALPPSSSLPPRAEPGTPEGARASELSDIPAPDPNPAAADAATRAPELAGTDRPNGVGDEDGPRPEPSANNIGSTPETPDALPAEDLAAAGDALDVRTKEQAEDDLEAARASGAAAAQSGNLDARDSADPEPVVVATVEAPASIDAKGTNVPTSLSIDGDRVTMHVDHADREVSYPIAADPLFQVQVVDYRIAWFPLMRAETYLASWEPDWSYIGQWHPVYCAWGMSCGHLGASWWAVGWNANSYLTYWPTYNWGPAWQKYWKPVYATRLVVDRWIPYWEPYLTTETVDTERVFPDAPMGDDTESELRTGGVTDTFDFEDVFEASGGAELRAAGTGGSAPGCRTRASIKQFVVFRPAGNPDQSGARAKATSTCNTYQPVSTAGVPAVRAYFSGVQVAGGTPCSTTFGSIPCTISSRFLAADRQRRQWVFIMKYNRIAPITARWRREAGDTRGIDEKNCSGYGTPVLNCTYRRYFSTGR